MAYFAVSIFLSAFLLFQIQPMVARNILPWFGGSSAVWSTVQMFFQVLLTGGYAYANWLAGRNKNRAFIHLVMLGLSLTLLLIFSFIWKSPITPGANWKPLPDQAPIWQICKLLLVAVGLPYFLLSTNSPLMQAWFSRTFPHKSAYRLYALSNAGSLLGLVTYPVLIEPYLTLAWQGRIWSLLYILYAGLAVFGAVRSCDPTRICLSISLQRNRNLIKNRRSGMFHYGYYWLPPLQSYYSQPPATLPRTLPSYPSFGSCP